MIQKSFKEISDNITEEEYREDGKMHYSTLATYERTGFSGLSTLFEKKESPSLLFGSVVDCLLTGTSEEFKERFFVADIPEITETLNLIITKLFKDFPDADNIEQIPVTYVSNTWSLYDSRNWKDTTKKQFIIEHGGDDYFKFLKIAGDRIIIDNVLYEDALNSVRALKESPVTKFYFEENSPFDSIERLYQLKFHTEYNGIQYSCMCDLIVVDHKNKIIQPVDLKTSFHFEYEFPKSFLDWNYQIQARQYYRCLEDTIKKDEYFKDFKINNYQFIVVKKGNNIPLVWEFEGTKTLGDIKVNNDTILRDPYKIASELVHYLHDNPIVPDGIYTDKPNKILKYYENQI